MERFAGFLARLNIALMVGGFVVASLLYLVNILLRFFAVGAITWIDQITGYLFAISPLLGSCLAIRTDENIKIDVLAGLVKSPFTAFFSKLICFAISCLFLWLFSQHFSIEWARNATKLGFIRQWMLDIPYIFFFFSGSIFFLESSIKELQVALK